ncbi:hypothetical protein COCON_G00101550 [Conger conger]|uniref:Uncharacterized protein n=1 Tax=Conger conger TaxID=82655 RepID=A0A9Q1DHZ3_CONCO|nr:hypothetical protein COCON_G00101550 [Conger conger]
MEGELRAVRGYGEGTPGTSGAAAANDGGEGPLCKEEELHMQPCPAGDPKKELQAELKQEPEEQPLTPTLPLLESADWGMELQTVWSKANSLEISQEKSRQCIGSSEHGDTRLDDDFSPPHYRARRPHSEKGEGSASQQQKQNGRPLYKECSHGLPDEVSAEMPFLLGSPGECDGSAPCEASSDTSAEAKSPCRTEGQEEFICTCCGKTFLDALELKMHEEQHSLQKQFTCSVQVASILEVLAKTAVVEITKLVDDGSAVWRLEMCRRQRENEALKTKLLLMEGELRAVRGYGVGTPGTSGAAAANGGEGPLCKEEELHMQSCPAGDPEKELQAELKQEPEEQPLTPTLPLLESADWGMALQGVWSVANGLRVDQEQIGSSEHGDARLDDDFSPPHYTDSQRPRSEKDEGSASHLEQKQNGCPLEETSIGRPADDISPFPLGSPGQCVGSAPCEVGSDTSAEAKSPCRTEGQEELICTCCGKTFPDALKLKTQEEQHSAGKRFSCSECGKGFTSSSILEKHEQYTVTVPENEVGALVVKMPVTNGDEPHTPAWSTKYKIIEGDNGGFFNVTTGPSKLEGIITTVKGLDFEKNAKYTLLVTVENDAPFVTNLPTSTATVIVNVEDVNEAPVFNPVEKPQHSAALPVLMFPRSSKGLKRQKRDWVIPPINFPENDRGPFPKQMVQLFAHAEVVGSTAAAEDPMEFIISVIDQNDEKPKFTEETFLGELVEGSQAGFEFMKVTAVDLDEPGSANSDIRYRIVSQDPESPSPNMFFINPITGGIQLKSEGLDRENFPKYTLVISAADMEGDGLSTTCKASITVTDSNDNAPQFVPNSYTVTVPENEVGALVVKMPVTDGDEPHTPAWSTKYKIIEGDNGGFFNVTTGPSKLEGIITTVKGLDFEKNAKYTLLVTVENDAPFVTNLPTSTATVIVNVEDVNDAPVFNPVEKPQHSAALPVLMFPRSSKGLKRQKRDWVIPPINFPENDRGPFPKQMVQIRSNRDKEVPVHYKITGPGADQPPVQLFKIDRDSGWLSVTQPLDRERQDKYKLFAHAEVVGSTAAAEDPMEIIISVIDQNDEKPKFTEETFLGELAEGSKAALLIWRGNGLSTTCKASITVTDSNDNAPQFVPNSYTVTVPENEVGALVVKMPVTDGDEPHTPAWSTKYKIIEGDNGGFFNVTTGPSKLEGIITTVKGLDFEKNAKYTLLVTVENDAPFVTNLPTSTATVIVNVEDVNEAPVFNPVEKGHEPCRPATSGCHYSIEFQTLEFQPGSLSRGHTEHLGAFYNRPSQQILNGLTASSCSTLLAITSWKRGDDFKPNSGPLTWNIHHHTHPSSPHQHAPWCDPWPKPAL